MKIFIGADHRGFKLKESLKSWLISAGHDVADCGNTVYDSDDDFPDFTFPVADGVCVDPQSRGIVLCGSAGGVTIAANKVKGIRAAASISAENVAFNRKHDDINVLAVPADTTDEQTAKAMVDAFVNTPFSGEPRHLRRLAKIAAREN